MKRLLSCVLALVLVLSLCACGQKAPENQGFQGLVLKAPTDVRVILNTGFENGTPVTPTEKYTEGDYTYYRFSGLEGGYACVSSGLGYYTVTKNISVTAADNQKETIVDVTPAKMAGTGWEAQDVQLFTDEMRQAFSDDISQWPEYADVFTTPWFTQEHAAHQTTTQTQLEDYLKSLDDADDDLYLFSTGITGTFRHDIPMAVLTTTDLSGATTLEEMAAALENGKPTILYRTQLHGNEPAGGEAALAVIMLLDSRWGNYLETMNICVVPRGNPDSAQNFIRNVAGSTDPNRDSLRARTEEVESYLQLCQLLMPEVIIDGHEFQCHVVDETVEAGDMLLGVGFTTESSDAFRALGMEVAEKVFAAIDENGLEGKYYSNLINTANANVSRAYASNLGTLFFLHESRGIGMGTDLYPRRIISHVVSVEATFEFVKNNAQKVMDTVRAEQELIVAQGSVYSEDNRIAIESGTKPVQEETHALNHYDQKTGQATSVENVPEARTELLQSVAAPTAYVLPAEEISTRNVLKVLDKHAFAYTFVPAGSKISLQQYSEEGLMEETVVTFPEGAYVICKNQIGSRNLSQMMEPEIVDHGTTKGTFVAQGMISAEDGKYPLYRYIHNLNSDGFIDYQS